MLIRILRELAFSFVLCLGERMLERVLFPGLQRTAERMTAADPSRVDDISTIVAEAIGLLAVVWVFDGSLYAIGWLSRRPLKPWVPSIVATVIVAMTFAGAYAQWTTLPQPPEH